MRLKEAIIQLLNVSGQNYEMTSIRPAIRDLATNMKWGVGFPTEEFGKPITYKNFEKAISENILFQVSQIFTPDKSIFFDDGAFLALLFKTIEPVIRSIMEKMTPEEFGYGRISPSEIGPGLKERREMIQSIKEKIQELEHKKGTNVQKLHALS
jgi:hypothetical protein